MRQKNPRSILFVLVWMFSLHPQDAFAQMTVGQYEDEAPFRTWNTLGFLTAASLAMGETQFASASDCSAALSNPGCLATLPKATLTLSSSFSSASFFKYSIVNTGVLSTGGENVSLGLVAFDFAGASLRVKGLTFALSAALLESYDRPSARAGSSAYSLSFNQEGILKNINFSVARKVFKSLGVGLGLNFVYGNLKKETIDNWSMSSVTITDQKSHQFRGFYLNAGVILELMKRIEIAAVIRTPYLKKSDSDSLYRYEAPEGNTDIKIEASGKSEYRQPFVAGLGLNCELTPKMKVSSDLTFFKWSKYAVVYFDDEEEIKRNFKDIIKIGAGVEYLASIRIFNQRAALPLRAGLCSDPQPMKDVNSSYICFSLGIGLHWRILLLDAGILLGREEGSGNSLVSRRAALSLSFRT
jgi:hypothetical protein